MSTIVTLIAALMLAACAATAPSAPPAGQPFTGDVWGWDERNNIVTLRQGGQTVRVKVTPDQLVGLRLHQRVTVHGELSPAEIEKFVIPPGRLVARGPAATAETTGSVTRITPSGTVGIDSARGPVTVWIATPGAQPFQAGDRVRVRLQLQPLDVLPPESGDVTRTAMAEPSAPAGSEPGEYAVVRGRVTAVAPGGQVTVESVRGPVTIWLPAGTTLRVGDWVDVQTSVHPAR
jgi:hypothetical protein